MHFHVISGVRDVELIEFCAIARAIGEDPVALFTQMAERLPANLDI